MSLLELENVTTYYAQMRILEGISLQVGGGELVCLLGGNASGKSTTLKTILGLVRPRSGRVLLDGTDVSDWPVPRRIARGIAIVPENRRLFGQLTVRENLELGAVLRRGESLAEDFDRVHALFPRLLERRNQLAGTLSGGEQQMVAMGRALMSRPRLLLMDEPSMGLSPALVQQNFQIISGIHASGVAVLVVEQNANMALSIADRGYVLSTGKIVLAGSAAELLSHDELKRAYLGRLSLASGGEAMYRALRRVPAETAHEVALRLIRAAGAVPGAVSVLRRVLGPRDPVLRVRALGLDFPGPLGLAAGFDKDARGVAVLGGLGFGFVEVGTVTARAQPGNAKPRLFRLMADRAIVNRMGFNNEGATAAAARLRRQRRHRDVIVGVNIGKTRAVPDDDAVADYVASARAVAGVADYVVVNVSSPNTPGLRDLQAVDRLGPLLSAVLDVLDGVPLLVKIAPDLADEDVDAIADLAVSLGLDGIIATNTTVSRDGLVSAEADVAAAGAGGLSGPPLRDRSLGVLRRLRERAGDKLVLIAAGGIETPDDAWERLAAGATLVQAYTGFVYGGPLWPRRINSGLAARARAAGLPSLALSPPSSRS
jgi:dihydroorotate dehydrogenase